MRTEITGRTAPVSGRTESQPDLVTPAPVRASGQADGQLCLLYCEPAVLVPLDSEQHPWGLVIRLLSTTSLRGPGLPPQGR